MHNNAADDFADIMASSGRAREAKLLSLYNKIYESASRDDFFKLVRNNFPEAIGEAMPLTARLLAPPGPDPNGVFSCYHPNLLRIPMQIIFISDRPAELNQAISTFLYSLKGSEHLIIGNMAYIEYIPEHITDVPDQNWEIKKWKAKNKTR